MTDTGKNTCGDQLSISSVYEENRPALMRYLVSYTRDTMDAEDMLQTLFLKLLSIDIINPETVRNLLFVMARRMIIDDAIHKAFVRRSVEGYRRTRPLDDEGALSSEIEARDLVSLVERRISLMPQRRAEVFMMSRHLGMSAEDIARELNLSRRTVESHIYSSSLQIRSYLRKVI